MKRLLLGMLLLLMVGHTLAEAPLPGASVYQLDVVLTDQEGRDGYWADRRGQVQLVSMFYTSCSMVCPMIVDTMKLTAQAVRAPGRAPLNVLLVSFDPTRDTVPVLHDYAQRRQLPAPRWTLARTASPTAARQLAAVLGLQYRQLPDGDFNHSSELILLDADGRIVARTNVIGRVDPEFVQAIERTLADK
ncbi:SCO family protein [Dyella japonica]|uniref:Electron transporter SenC n=1 Tax=Dyella japonica DSM 16301 TaxID=1440762 RepID=A0A0G9GZK2_9GAMM|nr:SCO family protein [Dyella japonica]KLD62631.1 electron transporter SenC [Dyella japonica DSM 16301]